MVSVCARVKCRTDYRIEKHKVGAACFRGNVISIFLSDAVIAFVSPTQMQSRQRAYRKLAPSDEFLEAWILAEWFKHWIQPEQRRSERRVCGQRRFIWDRQELGQGRDGAIRVAGSGQDACQNVERPG